MSCVFAVCLCMCAHIVNHPTAQFVGTIKTELSKFFHQLAETREPFCAKLRHSITQLHITPHGKHAAAAAADDDDDNIWHSAAYTQCLCMADWNDQ